MKITVKISATVERSDGTSATVERTEVHHVGDNPRFERVETKAAVTSTADLLVERAGLGGTTPL